MANQNQLRKPLISVIIPCYNYGDYIADALKSLQEQSYAHWECWVIDDGSTDRSAKTVQALAWEDPRINYIFQTNEGQPTARNTGLKKAKGDYIQFLDADDLLQPFKFETQLNFLEQHPDTDIAYSDVRYFNTNKEELFMNRWGNKDLDWMPRVSGKGLPMVEAFVKQNIFELGCALFRRPALEKVGPFDTTLQGVEDYDLCFRCAVAGLQFRHVDAEGSRCLMRHHASSFSKGMANMYKKELLLRQQMNAVLRSNGFRQTTYINKANYNIRLKRLQDRIIDQTIKGNRSLLKWADMKWMFLHSAIHQNIYFFPRVLKALINGAGRKMQPSVAEL